MFYKTYIYSIFTCVLILTFLFGCKNNITQQEVKSSLLTKAEIQEIGLNHNEALGKVLSALKQDNASIYNISKTKTVVNSALNTYYKNTFRKSSDLKTAQKYSSIEAKKYFQKIGNTKSKKTEGSNLSPIRKTIQDNKANLSDGQIKLLKEINTVLKNASSNTKIVIDKLKEIEKKAKDLSVKRAQVILVSTEIGKASIKYWNKNLAEWQQVLTESQNKKLKEGWFSFSEVVGADVAGGAGAAVTTAIINAAPGAGQVAYGSAILAGAAGGSTVSVVEQVWNGVF